MIGQKIRKQEIELPIILYLNNYQAALLASLTELQEALDRINSTKEESRVGLSMLQNADANPKRILPTKPRIPANEVESGK